MKPQIDEIEKYKNEYDIIPVFDELLSDFTTPMNVLRNIKEISDKFYLLESVDNSHFGRYSYLGYDPILTISCKDNIVCENKKKYYSEKPFDEIKRILSNYKAPKIEGLPPFCGGFVGYVAYDSYKYFEPKLKIKSKDVGFNDYEFLLFDKVICFDNYMQKIILIVNIKLNDLENNYELAKEEIDKLKSVIYKVSNYKEEKIKIVEELKSLDTKEEYTQKLNTIKKHIYDGDIFQCVFSRRFVGKIEGSLLETYRNLRSINPSPYMYYIKNEGLEIVGASPETLVSKEGDVITTFPIAGTRPRGKNASIDARLEHELLHDEKEIAEHNMLVDLGRNDIGRVSEFGSVKVLEYMKILRFSHVMHIASTVVGKAKRDLKSIDVLQSVLPAGTLSGAPKLRACEIIDSLEKERRGIYGGGIGYIDFRDNMNICIVIRTIVKKDNNVYVQAGGGIVALSDPENEYLETENKAKAVFKAVEAQKEK